MINDPEAPAATDVPNGEEHPMGGVFNGNANNREQPVHNVVNEELLDNTLAAFPGGPNAFWAGMQGSGIGREDFLQMLSSDLHPALRDTFLAPNTLPLGQSQSSRPPILPQSSQQPSLLFSKSCPSCSSCKQHVHCEKTKPRT